MKIGIDIRVLGKGRRTGIEDYTINLLSHLISLDKSIYPAAAGVKYRLFYNGFRKPKLDYSFLKLSNVEIKIFRFPNRILDLFLRFLRFPKLDKIIGGVDVFLSPHFLLAPLSKKAKGIIIFHDLAFVRFPEFFSLRKLIWHRSIYPKKHAKKTDCIVVVSESTKQDLIDLYGADSKIIKVIYAGVDKKFKPINKKNPRLLETQKKYKLPDNFILGLGTIEPRKNVLGLIKSFEQIKKTPPSQNKVRWQGLEGKVNRQKKKEFDFSNLKLVITGIKGWLYKEVFEWVEKSKFKNDIVFTGFIDEEDKVYLYNLANIFVYPSFFEGFGLPPLEAMASGVPVIVSNKSSLSEVVGDGAIMIDPYNIDEIAWAMKEVLENQDLRKYLIKQGLEKAKKFDWDKTAKEFMDLFIPKP